VPPRREFRSTVGVTTANENIEPNRARLSGALISIAINPDKMKSQTISDCVTAVVSASAAKITHSSKSLPTVVRTSFIALRTIIAMTAEPMP